MSGGEEEVNNKMDQNETTTTSSNNVASDGTASAAAAGGGDAAAASNGGSGSGEENKEDGVVEEAKSTTAAGATTATAGAVPAGAGGVGGKGNEDKKIFIGGISYETSNEDLMTYFKQFGEVAQAQVKYDQYTGRSRGFAFVEFVEKDSVQNVLKEKSREIKGKQVEIKPAKSRENKKIFIGGLPNDFPEEDLKTHFSSFGKIDDVEWPYDRSRGMKRNFAFIVFEDEASADNASKEAKQKFGERMCDVKKAVPQPKGGGRGGGMMGGGGRGGGGRGGGLRGRGGGAFGGYGHGQFAAGGWGGDWYGNGSYGGFYGGAGAYGDAAGHSFGGDYGGGNDASSYWSGWGQYAGQHGQSQYDSYSTGGQSNRGGRYQPY